MKKGIKIALAVVAAGVAVAAVMLLGRGGHDTKNGEAAPEDYIEYCSIGYSDIIAEIVQGYKLHWAEGEPASLGLSSVYGYESEFGGFVEKDINGDGVTELLIGDQFEDGTYALYDIYTFNRESGEIVHLLSGGERDSFVLNGSGAIVEKGSNSADDSFTKFFIIKDYALQSVDCIEDDLMRLQMDKFLRYVAPTMYVVVQNGQPMYQLIKTFDDCYLVEGQDSCRISKEGVEIELWSAYDGKGVVFLSTVGAAPVYAAPDYDSMVIGECVCEEGYCPESYRCLGYVPGVASAGGSVSSASGWFKIALDGASSGATSASSDGDSSASSAGAVGFVSESVTSWDFVDRN